MAKLSVNIDHIATLRQARGARYPDPVWAANIAELAGADGVTVHLRGDRRHIQERDLQIIKETITIPLTLEMATTEEMFNIALKYKPDLVTLVPERQGEKTTEGGLNLTENWEFMRDYVKRLQDAGLVVSLFVDPDEETVKLACELGTDYIEINTDSYTLAKDFAAELEEIRKIEKVASIANKKGVSVNAGHGLNYKNVVNIAAIPFIDELSIGHAIISRAVFVGLEKAIKEMLYLIKGAKGVQ